jgi:hypothetical protein
VARVKIRLVLFPDYVSICSALSFSPKLEMFLEENKAEIDAVWYNGTPNLIPSIPKEDGIITLVRASSRMYCSEKELAEACEKSGFICFFNDALIEGGGHRDFSSLVKAIEEFSS